MESLQQLFDYGFCSLILGSQGRKLFEILRFCEFVLHDLWDFVVEVFHGVDVTHVDKKYAFLENVSFSYITCYVSCEGRLADSRNSKYLDDGSFLKQLDDFEHVFVSGEGINLSWNLQEFWCESFQVYLSIRPLDHCFGLWPTLTLDWMLGEEEDELGGF